ncbi:MAG: SPFH domain-containing protein [Crocinitomicaceae bacterium]|nr:flotillin family protein [Crocinitomicaceae bacterium]
MNQLLLADGIGGFSYALIATAAGILFLIVFLYAMFRRYKRCPSDRILVVYGKVSGGGEGGRTAKCVHGGASFIWPIIQDYEFLDLTPISIEVELKNALSKQNIRVDVPSRFTVGISTEPSVMTNAAERLLGLTKDQIKAVATDILFGQLRLVVATMDIEEINNNRDKFLSNVAHNVEAELKKIGLKLINVNVTDIMDESGYIEALGKEAAAHAINEARKSVAEKNRDGSIGEANAVQDERIQVASAQAKAKIGEAEAEQQERIKISAANAEAKIGEAKALQNERIQTAQAMAEASIGEAESQKNERIATAEANARAIEGENTSQIAVAESDSARREKQAEAEKRAKAAEKVQAAKALEESYHAEQVAEQARAERDQATEYANIVIPAQIRKSKIEIDAEAQAENIRRIAKGEADAIYLKKEAEAKGIFEILTKQAEGFDRLVKAAGNDSKNAAMLMIADKLEEMVKLQAQAISNIKIDKVTVWDSGQGGKDGKTSTAGFLSGLYGSVPPLEEMFNMAGLELPDYLKKRPVEDAKVEVQPVKNPPARKKGPNKEQDSKDQEPKQGE